MAFRGWRKPLSGGSESRCAALCRGQSPQPLSRVRKKPIRSGRGSQADLSAPNKGMALQMFQHLMKWSSNCLSEVHLGRMSWMSVFFMDYPSSIRSVIYTTNAIERTIKEIRKRLKPMNSLSSLEAAEKVVYLTIQDFNEKWAGRN